MTTPGNSDFTIAEASELSFNGNFIEPLRHPLIPPLILMTSLEEHFKNHSHGVLTLKSNTEHLNEGNNIDYRNTI